MATSSTVDVDLTCSECSRLWPDVEGMATPTGDRGWTSCKSCVKEYQRRYRSEHQESKKTASRVRYWDKRDEILAQQKEAYQKSRPRRLAYALHKKFGLTMDEYNEMLEKQNGVCAICRQKDERFERLAVDHDHETGEIRGLLCGHCNRGLGHFRDNPMILQSATIYLTERTR